MIQPTVGRIVWYYPDERDGMTGGAGDTTPRAAIIAYVHDDHMVNLVVFDTNGMSYSRTSVTLVQPEDPARPDQSYCRWMPYQVKKDHGSESGEKAAGTQEV